MAQTKSYLEPFIGKSVINTSSPKLELTYHYGKEDILDESQQWHENGAICPQNKIFYILEGEICVVIKNNEIIAKAGDMMLIPAGVKHDYHLTPLQYAKKFWIHFDCRINKENIFDKYNFPYKITINNNPFIHSLFKRLINIQHDDILGITLTRGNLLCRLVEFYLKNCPLKQTNKDNSIWQVVEYINTHYLERPTLEELAQQAHLSPNQFLRRFKAIMGASPISFINFLRIDYAKHLIEKTEQSITEIMEIVGFYDFAHFSKTFKNYYHYSPNQYRILFKKNQLP